MLSDPVYADTTKIILFFIMASTSDTKELERRITAIRKQLELELSDRLPRKVGVIAVQHFKQNFHDSGFRNDGLRPWQKSKRELAGGKSASARYKTLTSARNHLMNSVQHKPSRGAVLILNPVPYASIHNEGGVVTSNPTITPQMRKFAWAMVYKLSGKRKSRTKGKKRRKGTKSENPLPPEAQKWRALALTKKTKIHIKAKMPKRQFMGESRELTAKINEQIMKSLSAISNGIPIK